MKNGETGEINIPATDMVIGDIDAMGGVVILSLLDAYPDITVGQVSDVLHAAQWWNTYFAAMNYAQNREGTE